MAFTRYSPVWLVAMFDLPTDTLEARRDYTFFRKQLLSCGFTMMQYSVYARYCANEQKAQFQRRKIKSFLPPDGEVRLISITDVQFGKMQVFHGKLRKTPEKAPAQVEMF